MTNLEKITELNEIWYMSILGGGVLIIEIDGIPLDTSS